MSISLNRAKTIAEVLEALPYIQKFTVEPWWSNMAATPWLMQLKNSFARDIVLMKLVGMNPIVVHGGGPDRRSAGKAQYRIELY